MSVFPEFGFYTLPGHADDPTPILDEPAKGEGLGLGSVWISERFGTKDIGVMAGATAATTKEIGIASGLLGQLGTRHPLVTASLASSMMELSGGRFALGMGRGIDPLADATGTPRITFEYLENYIGVMRGLWRGERVSHDSVVGAFPAATLGLELDPAPPIIMSPMGDKTCRWSGAHCDAVVLNSLWSTDAVAHSASLVRQGAEEAGRDPDSVRIWTILITACETSEENMLNWVIRRMNTYMYFPTFMEGVAKANGWDIEKAREVAGVLKEIDAGSQATSALGDEATSRDVDALRKMYEAYPEEWIHEGNAVGDRDHCCGAARERFDAGADGILFHGTTPEALAPLLEAWPKYRPAGLENAAMNPGLT